MITVKRKALSCVLAFMMVFAVFGVLGAGQINAEDQAVYKITKTSEDAKGNKATEVVKKYNMEQLESLADITNNSVYMWQKAGYINVYKIHKGVTFKTLVSDAGFALEDVAQMKLWDDAELSHYYKLGDFKSYVTGPTYSYLDARYDSQTHAIVYGEGTEVSAVLALDYDYSKGGISPSNADKSISELDDWGTDQNRTFMGMKGTDDVGGMPSMKNALTGLDLTVNYDASVEVNSQRVFFNKTDAEVTLPTTCANLEITGWSYVKKATADGEVDTVVDLGFHPTGEALAAAGQATLFPTPKTADEKTIVPATKISKLTVAKKAVKASYRVNGDAAGVQIQYKQKGASKWKTVNTTSLKFKKIAKLKKGKQYYVKTRAYYYTPKQVKVYGNWSPAKLSKKVK